ncbi:uncharacterized protein isoform X2 [Leptinotarsa decemlineata]|uniref:uncharacterized protein isoform X2 n=1 Tax=Leptinotarsa decemlineata TaxID=7539 RepID=UPI003D30A3AE
MFISVSILRFTLMNIFRQNMIQFVICFFVFQSFVLASVPKCPKVDGKYPVYFSLPDCTKFCQCSNGTLYFHDCPDGLHFNSVLNICDWPHRAGCDPARYDKDGDDNDGGNDNDCDDQKCEITTENAEVNICQQNGIECPKVDGKYPVYSALPDCTKFCQCSNGKPYLHECPDGLHFNSILNVCDWPHRAGCNAARNDTDDDEDGGNSDDDDDDNDHDYDDQKKEITTEKADVNICQQNEIKCPKVDGKYPVYSALPDCTKFCQCSNGKPYLHNCPDGLHFNSILNVCDWPHRAGCNAVRDDTDADKDCGKDDNGNGGNDNDFDGGNKETATEKAEVNICLQNGIECPKVDGKYPVYSALPDCTKFCQCSNGKPYLHGCPDGLHFNPELNVCDQPMNVNCSSISV